MDIKNFDDWYHITGIEEVKGYHVQSPRKFYYPFNDNRLFQCKEDAEERVAELQTERTFTVLSISPVRPQKSETALIEERRHHNGDNGLLTGLTFFANENCADCQECHLEQAAIEKDVNAEHLRTIGHGVCPFHPGKDTIPREQYKSSLFSSDRLERKDGVRLVLRIIDRLSGGW